jgi:hypothetical protein
VELADEFAERDRTVSAAHRLSQRGLKPRKIHAPSDLKSGTTPGAAAVLYKIF